MTAIGRRSAGRWLPDRLVEVERGAESVNDAEVADLVELYELSPHASLTASTVEFVVDRHVVGEADRDRQPSTWSHGQAQLEVAASFVAIAVLMGIDLATGIAGVDAVAEVMEATVDDSMAAISLVLESRQDLVGERIGALERRYVVPEAGLLVAEAPIGSLVLIRRARCEATTPVVSAGGTLSELLEAAR